MKKTVSILLVVFMLLGLCACGGDDAEEKGGLKAGFGRVNITPDYPVTMGGYSGRVSSDYRDYQYVTCIAVSDGNEIRRCAVENGVTIFTALDTVRVLLDVLEEITMEVSSI